MAAGTLLAVAVFVDLDRTLLRVASGPSFDAALREAGVLHAPSIPGQSLVYRGFNVFGESLPSMGMARLAAPFAKGWERKAVKAAAKAAVADLITKVAPYAPQRLAAFREQGHEIILATTTPRDLVKPLAKALDLDGVIATTYEVEDGRYTGAIDGSFVWGTGKLDAVRAWAKRNGVDLADCHACSDSFFDVPLLSAVGHPHPVNPDPRLRGVALLRRWKVEHWDRPEGVPSLLGAEPYHLLRRFIRPELMPFAQLDLDGMKHFPKAGPVIIISNHRSYFDVATLAVVLAKMGRPVRFLGKREIFEHPVVSAVARAVGGIPVDRGVDGATSYRAAESALEAGEVVVLLPEGTIPRGEAFFDPVLKGKTGAVRLAQGSGAPVVPVGLWGTEQVWPRSSKLPNVTNVLHPPLVRVRVGKPFEVERDGDAAEETAKAMARISALLPNGGVVDHVPDEAELARTMPDGHAGSA